MLLLISWAPTLVPFSGLGDVFWQEGEAAQRFLPRQPVRTVFPVPHVEAVSRSSKALVLPSSPEAEELGGGKRKKRRSPHVFSTTVTFRHGVARALCSSVCRQGRGSEAGVFHCRIRINKVNVELTASPWRPKAGEAGWNAFLSFVSTFIVIVLSGLLN